MVKLLLRCAVAILAIATGLAAQIRTRDADRTTTYPVTVVSSNGSHNGANARVISDHQFWNDGAFHVQNGGSGRCDLVIENGGMLVVEDAYLKVRGNIYLKEGGSLQLIRTDCVLHNSYPRQFNYQWEGGHLYTKDCTIGGFDNGASQIANFWLDRGVWTLRDTVVHHSGGILLGYIGHLPGLQGGTLDADGLTGGIASDGVVLLGKGDASVRNSTFPIKMDLHATHASTIDLDLPANTKIAHRVYGDQTVHSSLDSPPITQDIPGSPWRLELTNTTVESWAIAINEVRNSGPAFHVVLHNANDISLRILGHDLTGSPTYSGPWRSYYPAPYPLPGLPSSISPGEHGIPPGCSITIGNATFSAPSNQWAFPETWSFNFWGDATNYAVHGAMVIGEFFMDDAGQVLLEGDSEYNAGILAQTMDINGNANVTIRNATIGNAGSGFQAQITAYGRANVTLDEVVTQNVLLATERGLWWPLQGVNEATISMSNHLERGQLRTRNARAGSISIQSKTPSQNSDLSNLNFDGSVSSGRPDYWAVSNVNGSRSTTRRQGSASFQYQSVSNNGNVRKRLQLAEHTDVELEGWVRLNQITSGTVVRGFVQGSSGNRRSVDVQLAGGGWAYFCTGAYVVRSNDAWVEFGLEHSGSSSSVDVLCDDFTVRVSSWWEDDNLANLQFEDSRVGEIPGLTENGNAPNHWHIWHGHTAIETTDRRPGTSGARAASIEVTEGTAQLSKRLSFFEPGQQVRVRGWVKPENGNTNPLFVTVAELNNRSWDPSWGNNQQTVVNGTSWQFIDMTYTVPGGSLKEDFSTILISSRGDFLIDDFSVEVL